MERLVELTDPADLFYETDMELLDAFNLVALNAKYAKTVSLNSDYAEFVFSPIEDLGILSEEELQKFEENEAEFIQGADRDSGLDILISQNYFNQALTAFSKYDKSFSLRHLTYDTEAYGWLLWNLNIAEVWDTLPQFREYGFHSRFAIHVSLNDQKFREMKTAKHTPSNLHVGEDGKLLLHLNLIMEVYVKN
mmetsp:Transcript_14605/g.24907  ORF Transcript_14605/g.24907 Transcript_14605/m.24907 type:complete len:193 (-) Transcript_14605:1290-1868(-)